MHTFLPELTTRLPVIFIREVLIDVLRGVRQEVELVAFVRRTLGCTGSPGHVTSAPVAVDESPGVVHEHGRPLVAEGRALEAHARSVAGALGVAVDDFALQARVAASEKSDDTD